jgi:hypothetical protein
VIKNESDFLKWIDKQLDEGPPPTIVGYSINIYESPFLIEIIGSNEFDIDDNDWACNEDWVPQIRSIDLSHSLSGSSWEETQKTVIKMASSYIQSNSKNSHILKTAKGFAVGFVDGNLEYVQ